MKCKKFFVFLSCVFLLCLSAFGVFAESVGSLTIHFSVENSGVDTPISGAEFGISKIADYKNGKYVVAGDYIDDITADLNQMSSSDFEELSGKLELKDNLSDTTDESGEIKFCNLSQGLYFVSNVSLNDNAKNYQKPESYIVAVPFYYEGEWDYNPTSYPKTVLIEHESSEPAVSSEPASSKPASSKPASSKPSGTSKPAVTSTPSQASQSSGIAVITGNRIMLCLFSIVCVSAFVIVLCRKRGEAS